MPKKPRVALVSTVHQPFDVRIFHKEAVSLAAAGYDVVLIGRANASEVRQGVRIRPLPEVPNRFARFTLSSWRAYRAVLSEGAVICGIHDPELIPAGLLLKMHGISVVYDAHEDVVKDIVDKPYVPRWLRPLLQAIAFVFERAAAALFDRIIVATASIGRKFPQAKVTVLRNVPILAELDSPSPTPFADRPMNVVYVGGLAAFNGVEQMVRSMGFLPRDSSIRLLLAGRFISKEQEAFIRDLSGWERVDFHGWIERCRISDLFGRARAALVLYQPTPNIMECEPNKFFEVLSAGLPLIASDLPHWRSFIEQNRCGVVVDPRDPRQIARAVQELVGDPRAAESMGSNGRAAVARDHNWEAESARLLEAYGALVQAPGENIL